MHITSVALFYSNFSKSSVPCLNAIKTHQIPVDLIPLDTIEARKTAATGSRIQIKSVPSLVVIYDNGEEQLFIGYPKILKWMEELIQKRSQNPNTQPHNMPTQYPPTRSKSGSKKGTRMLESGSESTEEYSESVDDQSES